MIRNRNCKLYFVFHLKGERGRCNSNPAFSKSALCLISLFFIFYIYNDKIIITLKLLIWKHDYLSIWESYLILCLKYWRQWLVQNKMPKWSY